MSQQYAIYRKQWYESNWKGIPLQSLDDPLQQRQIAALQKLGTAALEDEDFTKVHFFYLLRSKILIKKKSITFSSLPP